MFKEKFSLADIQKRAKRVARKAKATTTTAAKTAVTETKTATKTVAAEWEKSAGEREQAKDVALSATGEAIATAAEGAATVGTATTGAIKDTEDDRQQMGDDIVETSARSKEWIDKNVPGVIEGGAESTGKIVGAGTKGLVGGLAEGLGISTSSLLMYIGLGLVGVLVIGGTGLFIYVKFFTPAGLVM